MIAGGRRYVIYKSRTDKFKLYTLGDMHMGSRNCALKILQHDVAEIAADPKAFWLGMGDYADYVGFRDAKRFDPDGIAQDISVADLGQLGKVLMQRVRDVLAPIKDKCVGLLYGNHEDSYQICTEQQHLHGWLCTELGVPDLGYSCFVDLVFVRVAQAGQDKSYKLLLGWPYKRHGNERWRLRIRAHHGAGAAQTAGGKLNRLVQFMQQAPRADLVVCGHVHDQVGRRLPYLDANKDCTDIVDHARVGVISGTYLKTYAVGPAGYGEKKGYDPTPLGCAVVDIEPDKRRIRGEV